MSRAHVGLSRGRRLSAAALSATALSTFASISALFASLAAASMADAHSAWPFSLAHCSAVRPAEVRAAVSAPARSWQSTTAEWPW